MIDGNLNLLGKHVPQYIASLLEMCPCWSMPTSRQDILSLAMGGQQEGIFEVAYEVPGRGRVIEATVTKCKNGLAVNYTEPYMRRRDPHCMVVADEKPTDKATFIDRFGKPFEKLRLETFGWLKQQKLVVMPFIPGGIGVAQQYGALLIAPNNAGFFIGGLADLQGMILPNQIPDDFQISSVIYLAPPFRHTHFDGKQIVVHNRLDQIYEIFSYNLYPGPSAKKGVYGVLLSRGEKEDWPTLTILQP